MLQYRIAKVAIPKTLDEQAVNQFFESHPKLSRGFRNKQPQSTDTHLVYTQYDIPKDSKLHAQELADGTMFEFVLGSQVVKTQKKSVRGKPFGKAEVKEESAQPQAQ